LLLTQFHQTISRLITPFPTIGMKSSRRSFCGLNPANHRGSDKVTGNKTQQGKDDHADRAATQRISHASSDQITKKSTRHRADCGKKDACQKADESEILRSIRVLCEDFIATLGTQLSRLKRIEFGLAERAG
jgi:hypothetical protein